jgi:two-component sensor histidine kinase
METGRELERTRTLTAQLAECQRQFNEAKSAESLLRETQERLKASLREKDLLVRDIHHRVKNNLQVIASLISLQARPGIHPAALSILNQLQGRVRAILALHEALYNSPDLGSILFGAFMQQLSAELLALYAIDRGRISVHVDAADMVISVEQALPLGLILTELVANCLKHAFSQEQEGVISLCLRYVPTGSPESLDNAEGELSVSDNGIGLRVAENTAAVQSPERESTGLHLIELLVAELDGTLQVGQDQERGVKFTIRFPLQFNERNSGAKNTLATLNSAC